MKHELKPGMRVRVTDLYSLCDRGTLVWFDKYNCWLMRLDYGGWMWDECDAGAYPEAPVSIGDRGFGWVYPGDLEPLPESKNDFSEAIEHLEKAMEILKQKTQ